jgi:N-methylhydantoinase A
MRATVTDAHAVLGNLLPHLLDGALSLDREAAIRVVKVDVAEPLGLTVEEAAQGIIDVINNNMMAAIRLISIERGHDPRDFALLPFGGAGPLHGGALAELLGCRTIILPTSPGVLSSMGLLVADLRSEYSRTSLQHPPNYDLKIIADIYMDLEEDAVKWFSSEQIPVSAQEVCRTLSLRYEHQGFELVVEWPSDKVDEAAVLAALGAFEALHQQLYTFNQPGTPIEMVTFRVEAIGRLQRPKLRSPEPPTSKTDAKVGLQRVWSKGQYENASVFDRRRLSTNQEIQGPAIIQQPDTTTVLLRGQTARVHESGSLLIHSVGQ